MTTTTSAPNVNNTSTTASAATSAPAANSSSNTSSAMAQQQPQQQQQTTPRTMQSDEDFNIRFVNLVRIHKCLYDKKVPEYRNRDNQEKAWLLISQKTSESVIHCKERWRNLRACLSRYIKQQSGADPQHKPYYLTEHMAFLLPFLKSTRNSLDGNNSLASLFQISQQHLHPQTAGTIQVIPQPQLQFTDHKLELKHSDNDDEDTLDAFDTSANARSGSPPLSDTASANTLQNFIPLDVQLAELRTPDPAQDIDESHDYSHDPKRIKTECHSSESTWRHGEHSDMEFFRSILPDIAALTPQQKRKFKIGILELIDDVVDRYPAERNSAREWRK